MQCPALLRNAQALPCKGRLCGSFLTSDLDVLYESALVEPHSSLGRYPTKLVSSPWYTSSFLSSGSIISAAFSQLQQHRAGKEVILETGVNCMATSVIYFSLMEMRPSNLNLSGGSRCLDRSAQGSAGDRRTHPAMLTHPPCS
ncbi:uncharacterized protein J5F26_015781 isoform 1-T1 [Ciconia maguari]